MSSPSAWHCTADAQTWPGCGCCAGCLESMPVVYAAARRQAELIEWVAAEAQSALLEADWEMDREMGQ